MKSVKELIQESIKDLETLGAPEVGGLIDETHGNLNKALDQINGNMEEHKGVTKYLFKFNIQKDIEVADSEYSDAVVEAERLLMNHISQYGASHDFEVIETGYAISGNIYELTVSNMIEHNLKEIIDTMPVKEWIKRDDREVENSDPQFLFVPHESIAEDCEPIYFRVNTDTPAINYYSVYGEEGQTEADTDLMRLFEDVYKNTEAWPVRWNAVAGAIYTAGLVESFDFDL